MELMVSTKELHCKQRQAKALHSSDDSALQRDSVRDARKTSRDDSTRQLQRRECGGKSH